MSEATAKIVRLERGVMSRKRLLSLQDGLAPAVSISASILAIIVVLVRLRPISLPLWPLIIAAMSLSIAAVLIRWFLTRPGEGDAAFLIDDALKLDDRIATSRLIIQRGGPTNALEEALLEDAAERLGTHRAGSLVPFRTRMWDALSLICVMGLAAALMIPGRPAPVDQSLAAERADIESAGEHLEQTATEVEQSVAPGTETATLANEQAELGRAFRRSTASRSEALRRLTALEERIRKRHDDLANTRADEIVSLADRRLGSALSTLSTPRRAKTEADESQHALTADERSSELKGAASKAGRVTTPGGAVKAAESSEANAGKSEADPSQTQPSTKGSQGNAGAAHPEAQKQARTQKRQQEPVSGKGNETAAPVGRDSNEPPSKVAKEAAGRTGATVDQKPNDQRVNDQTGDQKASDQRPFDALKVESNKPGDQNIDERKASDQKATELPAGSPDLLKAVPDSLAEQAARALPKLSAELLKKAAELRANELTPADIEKLRKAAEFLSRDLTQIEQSKELQEALQEMARQIRPEQIEQVARELRNQEKLKQELEAAARLLSQNQQAREMVTGLADQFARTQEESRRDNQRGGGKSGTREPATGAHDPASRSNRTSGGGGPAAIETAADRRLAGQGRQASLKGKLQQGSAGEYLFLQTRAGVGAARAPYSSAYPQYRREAERSVQRSQVPPNLRSVVRKYFDAINPDAKR